jgi:hypothetical protein
MHKNDIVELLDHIQTKTKCMGMINPLVFPTWWKNLHERCKEMMQCMKCVILLDFKNKLYVGTEMHVDVHAWNCMILLDKNISYARTELHVVVHAWNYVILLDFYNKLWAGTKTHVDVAYWFVLSTMNQVFAVELYCLQRISVRCRIMLSTANQGFTTKL